MLNSRELGYEKLYGVERVNVLNSSYVTKYHHVNSMYSSFSCGDGCTYCEYN